MSRYWPSSKFSHKATETIFRGFVTTETREHARTMMSTTDGKGKNAKTMSRQESFLWQNYGRIPDDELAAQAGLQEDKLFQVVRSIGWKYFGKVWRQRMQAEMLDEESIRIIPPEVIRQRCLEIQQTWSPEEERRRRGSSPEVFIQMTKSLFKQ